MLLAAAAVSTPAQDPFGLWIAAYFALAALAAGLAAHSGVRFLRDPGRGATETGIARKVALLSIVAGTFALIADLSSPNEFWLILTSANASSWISWGSRILVVFATLLLAGVIAPTNRSKGHRALTVALIGTAGLMMIYPALVLMQSSAARSLWDSALLAPLFVISALHLGASATPECSHEADHSPRWARTLILAEIVCFAAFLIDVGISHLLASNLRDSALLIAVGGLSWGVPRFGRSKLLVSWSAILGAFCMRAWILLAGQSPQAFTVPN